MAPLQPSPGTSSAVFALVRGGPSLHSYETLVQSRRCLRDSLPAGFRYDNVVFHEGNVPLDVQTALRGVL